MFLLESALPALPTLKELKLNMLDLVYFPAALAARLCQLTVLDLSYNLLQRLPAAVTLITSLKSLNVSNNLLKAHEGDGHLLAALPNLCTITMLEQKTMLYPRRMGHPEDGFTRLQAIPESFSNAHFELL